MALADLLGIQFRLRHALLLGALIAQMAVYVIMPIAIRKLRNAGVVGRDRHKPDRTEVAEMGGLATFLAFNVGAFVVLALGDLHQQGQVLVLAALVVIAGAALTGALDDLIILRQRFKAMLPFAFAVPLALYVEDTTLSVPFFGSLDVGIWYAVLLVPLGVACASNGFNLIEGFNGLGAGLGLIVALALSAIILVQGDFTGLVVLAPLIGALLGFLFFNWTPARIFPGDTMTLMVGAVIACAAILSKVEFWGALLVTPYVIEFIIKARGRFEGQCFASEVDAGRLFHHGPIESLTHLPMRWMPGIGERQLVVFLLATYAAFAALTVGFHSWSM